MAAQRTVAGAVQRRGPGSRADDSHPTRTELLDAAVKVVERVGLAAMTINDVTKEAELAKGTFYIHFTDRSALLVAIHRRFHDDLFALIGGVVGSLPPGRERAAARVEAFLDGCRRQPAVRALLLQARTEPAISDEVARRNNEAVRMLTDDLRAARRTGFEAETARLITAATIEAAALELAAKRRLPLVRKAVHALVMS